MILPSRRSGIVALTVLLAFFIIFVSHSAGQQFPGPPVTPGSQAEAASQAAQQTRKEQESSGRQADAPEDAAYKAITDTAPGDADKRIKLGEQYLQKYPVGKYREQVYSELTVAAYVKQDFAKMSAYANKALDLDPNDVTVLVLLGWDIPHNYDPKNPESEHLLQMAESYELRALALLPTITKSANITPDEFTKSKEQLESQAHGALGLIYFRLRNFEKSIAQLQIAALRQAGQDPTNYYVMGVDLTELKRFLESADAFEKCAEIAGAYQDRCKHGGEQAKHQAAAQQGAATSAGHLGTVDVRLKDPAGEQFSGVATIHLFTIAGSEAPGSAVNSGEKIHFADITPGSYIVEVTAPGFASVRQPLEISAERLSTSVFLTMTPETIRDQAASGSGSVPISTATTREDAEKSLQALRQADSVPPVMSGITCPLPLVLNGVAQRVEELVDNLDRFSATERVDHFAVRPDGDVGAPDSLAFQYVVVVARGGDGDFQIDEYRDGGDDPASFPARVATVGLPALALVFHPKFASEFNFVCEGLGEFGGKPAWQVHFAQRPDRPNQMRSYVVYKNTYPVPLQGRVMIDAATFQVLRMESELAKPIPEIKLTREHILIDYALVQFRTGEQQLWLPQSAELYVERNGNRYYRRHTFSNFQVFTVGTDQKIHAPKESYAFTNKSDHEIFGTLTVNPVAGRDLQQVSVTFRIPAGRTVFEVVGPGKDVNLPVESVESARFAHNGAPGSVDANAYFVKASTLELIPETVVLVNAN